MTAHAQLKSWHMLQDCVTALQMLERAVNDPKAGKDVSVLWVAAVAMLRGVGHALEKVDAANNPEVKRLLKEAWPRWKKAPLFQLSDGYRNKTLKEYKLGWEHRRFPVWSAPHTKPEDDPNVRTYGFLMVQDHSDARHSGLLSFQSVDAMRMLWLVWQWWMDRVAALGHLIGSEPLSDRQKTYDCFIGRARITRQAL